MSTPFAPSIKPQDLSDDKMILSAPRTDLDGRATPTLGGIQILAKLGQGGMGAVYYGIHPRLNQEVAVKVLPFHLAEHNPELVQRFIREAQIAARVRSPHLVSVIDVNEQSGLFYLVMEYVSGQTAGAYLRELGRRGQFGMLEREALDICIAALEGLAAAHAQGVIHRDIKPDNIIVPLASSGSSQNLTPMTGGLLAAEGASIAPTLAQRPPLDFSAAKLADLGLARSESGDVTMTGVNACMGTPGYMSPEQAQDARHVSKPADVFSMGATLYAMITGNAPFQGTALMHVLNATVKEPHTPIRQIRPDISAATSAVLDRCLQKDPAQRFSDAGQLLSALRSCRETLEGREQRQSSHGEATIVQGVPKANLSADLSAVKQARTSMGPQPAVETLPEKSHGLGLAAALFAAALLIAGVGGYGAWTLLHEDAATHERELQAEREKTAAEVAARFEEQRKSEAALLEKQLQEADRQRKDREEADRAAAAKRAEERLENERKAQLAEDEKKREAAAALAEQRRRAAIAQESLAAAVTAATEYKAAKNWPGVVLALESPLKALANRPHPNRALAETLLAEAHQQLARQNLFNVERERANAQMKAQSFDDAKNTYEGARKFAVDDLEKKIVEDGIRNAEEGLRQNKIIQAQALERQGRALKPDVSAGGDWFKAADSFKSAAELFQQAERKEDQARNFVFQADCLRKDKNKNGDWSQAAGLYAAAAKIYFELGDKKNQAEALGREAYCWDPALNPTGSIRQVVMLYGLAAKLHGEVGNKKSQADYLSMAGGAAFKNKPKGYESAAEFFAHAAANYGELNERKAEGISLLNQALSTIKMQRQNMTPEAKKLLLRAAELCRESGDEADAKIAEGWTK